MAVKGISTAKSDQLWPGYELWLALRRHRQVLGHGVRRGAQRRGESLDARRGAVHRTDLTAPLIGYDEMAAMPTIRSSGVR